MQLKDHVHEVGVPNIIIHDDAKEMGSQKWLEIVGWHTIAEHTSKPHHQNQNLAERQGDDIKCAFKKLFHEMGTNI